MRARDAAGQNPSTFSPWGSGTGTFTSTKTSSTESLEAGEGNFSFTGTGDGVPGFAPNNNSLLRDHGGAGPDQRRASVQLLSVLCDELCECELHRGHHHQVDGACLLSTARRQCTRQHRRGSRVARQGLRRRQPHTHHPEATPGVHPVATGWKGNIGPDDDVVAVGRRPGRAEHGEPERGPWWDPRLAIRRCRRCTSRRHPTGSSRAPPRTSSSARARPSGPRTRWT